MKMPVDTLEERARRIIEEFSALEDWIERYRYLVAMGDAMPRVADADKTGDNYIPGCQYDVWIQAEYDAEDQVVRFRADSTARITRGLAALILRVADGQPPAAIADADFEFLDTIGLRKHLSAQRTNGLSAMVHRMKTCAREHRDANREQVI